MGPYAVQSGHCPPGAIHARGRHTATTRFLIALAGLLIGALTAHAGDAPMVTRAAGAYKSPAANKGAASLVFFYTGDDKWTNFFQETIKLKKAMEGYKKVVLLKHQQTPPWADMSEKDEKLANVIELPTRNNIAKYLKELADDGYYVDIWIIGHGTNGQFIVSNGSYGSNSTMTADEIRALPKSCGYSKLPIRMVWSTLCYGSTLNSAWLDAGAKVVGGSRFVNFYPNQFGEFADEWNRGNVSYADAIAGADSAASRTAVQTYVSTIHAPSTKKDWGGCPVLKTVLGDHDCAHDYFKKEWGLGKDEWQSKQSGKENMNHSSSKILTGDRKTTKQTTPKW